MPDLRLQDLGQHVGQVLCAVDHGLGLHHLVVEHGINVDASIVTSNDGSESTSRGGRVRRGGGCDSFEEWEQCTWHVLLRKVHDFILSSNACARDTLVVHAASVLCDCILKVEPLGAINPWRNKVYTRRQLGCTRFNVSGPVVCSSTPQRALSCHTSLWNRPRRSMTTFSFSRTCTTAFQMDHSTKTANRMTTTMPPSPAMVVVCKCAGQLWLLTRS